MTESNRRFELYCQSEACVPRRVRTAPLHVWSAHRELTEHQASYPKIICRAFTNNEGFARREGLAPPVSRLELEALAAKLPTHSAVGLLLPRIITSRNARGNPRQRLAVFSQGSNATAVSALFRSGSQNVASLIPSSLAFSTKRCKCFSSLAARRTIVLDSRYHRRSSSGCCSVNSR